MKYAQIADRLSSDLELGIPPVALAFVDGPPEGVPTTDATVPSSCAFWRKAEEGVFYAPAEAHFNCPIGAMVMGFDLTPEVQSNLGEAVEMMCDISYLGADEPANIPSVKKPKQGIVYGPLADFPIDPDVALLWVTSRQAMLLSEAVGNSRWMEAGGRTVFGRPACASIPSALDSDRPVMSLGCMGMRTYTEVLPDLLLSVVPGSKLDEFQESVVATMEANRQMQEYYEQQKAQFA
jgi:uncharacterized protein (DUF169 family)